MTRLCLLAVLYAVHFFAHAHGHDHRGVALQFHENKGQWPDAVLYRALTPGGAVFVENTAFTYLLHSGGEWEAHGRKDHVVQPLKMHAFKVHFEGGNAQANEGSHRMPHYVNYFVGDDREKWASNVGVYAQLQLNEVYPGIGLRVDGHSGMKYDWLVAAGADPSQIVMRYEGTDELYVEGGLLFIKTSAGDLIEQRPVAWQDINGQRVPVECEYVLEKDRLRFGLTSGHDGRYPLVIDPVVVFSSFSGSTGDNFGFTATYDDAGHLYAGGLVLATGYPTTTGVVQPEFASTIGCDMGISKFSADGTTLIWSTYLGGSESEVPHSMVVNSMEELYVMGTTNSTDFPVTDDAYQGSFQGGSLPPFAGSYGFTYSTGSDIVVTHFNVGATELLGSTYVGGTGNDGLNQYAPLLRNYGDPFRGEIILDANEDPMVVSSTTSMGLYTSPDATQPELAGGLDAYVFRMDPPLSNMLWATYHGGLGHDAGYGIQISSTGDVYITGGTLSTDLATTPDAYALTNAGDVDGYIARFNAAGTALLSSTYLGTAGFDQSYFIQLDLADDVFVVGQTAGNYPVTPGKYANPNATQFIHKFSGDLTTSEWSTRIGGTGNENLSPSAFLVSFCGQIYFSGWGGSTNIISSSTMGLPVTADAYQSTTTGSDFYLMMLEPEAVALGYATFFGGDAAEHVDGGTSRFDKNGIVYQAVCAGCGGTNSFPTTPGVWSNTNNSANCNLGVFKIDFEQAVQVMIEVDATDLTACLGEPVVFNAIGSANTWVWDLGTGEPMVAGAQVEYTYNTAGTYDILLIGVDSASCNFADTAYATLTVTGPVDLDPSFEAEPLSSCQGYNVTLVNTSEGNNQFLWNFGDGTTGTQPEPTHYYQLPGTYEITLVLIDPVCADTATAIQSIVLDPPWIELDLPSPIALCDGESVQLNAGTGFSTYLWSTGQFTSSITVQQPGIYSVSVNDGICTGTDTVVVVGQPDHEPAADLLICPGTPVEIQPTFPVESIIWSTGDTSSVLVPTLDGEYWFTAVDEYGCTHQDTILVIFIATEEGMAMIPNVFSPNNDQQNDVFQVGGHSLEQFSMEVFNRWGQLMFASSNPVTGWNGGLNNSPDKAPEGTYFYVITFQDRCSNEPLTTHHGHVTLVR